MERLGIFQTWKSRDPETFPPVYKKCQESWQRLHPDVDYKLFDDKDNDVIIAKYFSGKLEEVYNSSKNGVEKADIIRYVILYLCGGLYADMDLMALKSHEELFNSADCILLGSLSTDGNRSDWEFSNSIPNAWIISKHAYEVFWLIVLDEICERSTQQSECVEFRTGPIVLKHCLRKYSNFTNVDDAISSLKHITVFNVDQTSIRKSDIKFLLPHVVYPNSWLTSEWESNKAFFLENDWDAICSKFPNSIAFTYWAHNW
jgi:mannosyltransferase OCH1-like enzyme